MNIFLHITVAGQQFHTGTVHSGLAFGQQSFLSSAWGIGGGGIGYRGTIYIGRRAYHCLGMHF